MSPTRLLVALLFVVFVVLTGLNVWYYHSNMQQIEMGIRALDPTHTPSAEEYAALQKSLSEHKNLRDEKNWVIGREVALVVLAGVGIVLLARRKRGQRD